MTMPVMRMTAKESTTAAAAASSRQYCLLLMVFVVLVCSLQLTAASALPDSRPQRDNLQQMEKRFYAWDEMSAKRSLMPARPETGSEVIGVLEEEPIAAMPIVLKRSKLDEWKHSLRQRQPALTQLFFGPPLRSD